MMDSIEMREFIDQLLGYIYEKLKYYRTYSAVVKLVEDIDNEGKVALECLDLAASDTLSYIWARPCGGSRSYHPAKVDDDVILFFKDADPCAPVFIAEIPEGMAAQQPKQMLSTIIETEMSGSIMTVDEVEGFTMESKSVKGAMSSTSEMCLGAKMKDLFDYILDKYITDIYTRLEKLDDEVMNHKHTAPMGPTSSALPPTPVNRAKDKAEIGTKKGDISTKKSNYAMPGNLLSHTNRNN